jgi:hypothetical protein
MAKWTVALFGHWKPKDFGWEKRPEPGDIVAFKSSGQDWTDTEKKEFLMVTIDGPEQSQMNALCETYFDLNSYELYDPLSFDDWYSMMYLKAETSADPQKAIALLDQNKTEWYAEYIKGAKERCRWPKLRYRSRRFHVPLNDLKILGVDEAKMLNRDLIYEPVLADIIKTQCYDKKNARYVLLTDELNELQPLTDGELNIP